MISPSLNIEFEAMGIASVLQRFDLTVPPNQRAYKWTEAHVRSLFEDLTAAKNKLGEPYFLGTIVLTKGRHGKLEVADGQQRLATTSILISAIRDFLWQANGNERQSALTIANDYLVRWDIRAYESRPKLGLNTADANFFTEVILKNPDTRTASDAVRATSSNDRLIQANRVAGQHVAAVVSPLGAKEKYREVYDWIDFLKERAVVIAIIAPDSTDAFKMFETLNDRGLRASQTDILKNFLFSEAGDRSQEAEPRWNAMSAVIEAHAATGKEDELTLDFIRHFWIARNGPTLERDLAESMKKATAGRMQAITLLDSMQNGASDYIALLAPLGHPRWTGYPRSVPRYVDTITNMLGIEQLRPLLLALMNRFDAGELKKALRLLLSCSVRFLIAGGAGGGTLNELYGQLAKRVTSGEVQSAATVRQAVLKRVPTDQRFQDAFTSHPVSKDHLARYYLASLNYRREGVAEPEIAYIDNPDVRLNLEHVMPKNPSAEWNLKPDTVREFHKRLGNLTLMNPGANVKIGNDGFERKKLLYREDGNLLTQEIASRDAWGPSEIISRQEGLARLALEVWKL